MREQNTSRSKTSILTTLLLSLVASTGAISSTTEGLNCSAALGQATAVVSPGLASTIRMMSWNIEKSQNPGWEEDLRELGRDRQLLLIQEASAEARIASALPQPLFRAFAAGYTTKSLTSGVLTLSSVEPSLQCNLTAWEPWLGTPKATNITEYLLVDSDYRLLVVNLHAVNFTVGQEEFAAQIDALKPILSSHRGPMLVAGDFNTWSNSRGEYLQQFMAEHELAAIEFTEDKRTTFWSLPLDHIYLRGMRAVEARVVVVDTSDHNPLLVTLEIIE